MPAAASYQRARRPEHKQERREAILAAAAELAAERPVREVSLGDIARRVGLAKSNVLRYFESREHVFLELLLAEWESWFAQVSERLAGRRSAAGVAGALASTLAERPLFCDLISELSSVLERNVSTATVHTFKLRGTAYFEALGTVVVQRLPGLAPSEGRQIISTTMIMTAGLWPTANPPAHVRDALDLMPDITPAERDFETRLAAMLTAVIRGHLGP
jgi:AcrR family transcriptional regulator